ncbi:AraC family transcriptional regulator [Pedobacter sp. HDW13]|uniref:AraC family transcriptional regulator n=1 Tax=unclassified Pedobacter TaxID=2628915 RepID=UPI000F5ADF43|nr:MULTISPECIES: AraC family transcriptional regulator [unclassified Pedobacter]QIL40516.1 AraC family transcriptional regulator [Pedobacter sp. HDW13]RQO66566.1 AraC family transcriptional regulator [Pedobacter sp. KBW01]
MNYFLHEGALLAEQITIPEEVQNSIKNMPFKNLLYITQIGQSPLKSETHTPDYVLIYCLTGKLNCNTSYGNFQLKSNQFMLLPPNEFYSYEVDEQYPGEIYCLHFNGNMINELNVAFGLNKFASPTELHFDGLIIDSWNEIFNSLSKELSAENIAYANLCLYRFISFFLFSNQKQKPVLEREDQLEQSISYMKANLHKRLCVDEIAETFRYSPSHYSVLFKQKTGLSPIEYFIRIKIKHASELLTTSNLIVKEIAGEVGYDDPFYFTRIFKKVTGKTPREYKELNTLSNRRHNQNGMRFIHAN